MLFMLCFKFQAAKLFRYVYYPPCHYRILDFARYLKTEVKLEEFYFDFSFPFNVNFVIDFNACHVALLANYWRLTMPIFLPKASLLA